MLIVSLAYALEFTQQCSLHRSMYVFQRERHPLCVTFSSSAFASSKLNKGNVPPLFHCFDKSLLPPKTRNNSDLVL